MSDLYICDYLLVACMYAYMYVCIYLYIYWGMYWGMYACTYYKYVVCISADVLVCVYMSYWYANILLDIIEKGIIVKCDNELYKY